MGAAHAAVAGFKGLESGSVPDFQERKEIHLLPHLFGRTSSNLWYLIGLGQWRLLVVWKANLGDTIAHKLKDFSLFPPCPAIICCGRKAEITQGQAPGPGVYAGYFQPQTGGILPNRRRIGF